MGAASMRLLILLSLTCAWSHAFGTDHDSCIAFARVGENYKSASTYQPCLDAARAGDAAAQYSVGMALGFAGNASEEERYYRLAAAQHLPAAYLALGHVVRDRNEDEAIDWYKKYVDTRAMGWGYAAALLAKMFSKRGDVALATHWTEICRQSDYEKNCGVP
jgi:TPR repeat protein